MIFTNIKPYDYSKLITELEKICSNYNTTFTLELVGENTYNINVQDLHTIAYEYLQQDIFNLILITSFT